LSLKDVAEMNYHDRKVEHIKKFWEGYGAIPLDKPRYFIPDLIMDISLLLPIVKQLDCSYIWIEVVGEHPCTPEKMEWLPKLLSKEWLILRYDYGESFTPQRPVTYKGKMTSEKTKDILHKLIQQSVMLKQILSQSVEKF